MIDITDNEQRALATAMIALEDMAMVLEGQVLGQIGIDPSEPGARDAAERLRRAARTLDVLRERERRDRVTGHWWGPN
jgi:hypothetical protein